MNKKIIKTQCPFCGTGCGLEVIIDENGNIKVRGDKEHPATKGSICIKAVHLPKALDVGRVDKVLYRESKKEDFKEIDWDFAYKILKEKLDKVREEFKIAEKTFEEWNNKKSLYEKLIGKLEERKKALELEDN